MKHGEMLSMTNRSQTSQHGSTKRSLLPKTYWQWSLTSRYRIMERLCLSIEDHDRTRGDCRAPSSSSQRTHPRCLWYDRLHGSETHSIHTAREGDPLCQDNLTAKSRESREVRQVSAEPRRSPLPEK